MSTYTSYNSYLGNKLCCKTVCEEKCNNSSVSTSITGPAGPAGEAGAAGVTGAQGPTGSSANQNLQQVLSLGNSAGSQSATDFNNVGAVSVETGKVYQGNFLSLQIGETGDTLQIKGATNLGSMLAGNGVNTEELVVGADGLFLKADSGASLGVSWAAAPTLQQVLTAGNSALNTEIILTSSLPTTNTISSGGMVTTGILNLNGDSVSINTTGNNVGINSGTSVNIVATDGVYLTASNDPMTLTSAALMTLNSADDINLTATTSLTGKINVNATNGLVINQQGLTPPDTTITTLNGNIIEIFEDKNTSVGIINTVQIDTTNLYIDNTDNTNQTQSYCRVSPNEVEIYDHTNSGGNASITKISSTSFDYNPSGTKPLFYQFTYEVSNIFRYDNTGIKMGASGTGVKLNANNIQYPASYNTNSATLGTTSNAVQTFNINVAPFTAFLPNASDTNVGIQYTITNTNANSLVVSTTGGTQLIYSTIVPASATSRTLAQGHSHIFTAILTTGASTYGWSMV